MVLSATISQTAGGVYRSRPLEYYKEVKKMMQLKEVQTIPAGKGIRVNSLKNGICYDALVIRPMTQADRETKLRLITENGHLTQPMFKNYGKSWAVERVN